MTDRELQDEIIRYVSDPQARRRGDRLKITPPQAERAAQFARFLARRYYRDRLGRSFRYSALLQAAGASQRRATEVVESGDFESLVGKGVLGSLELAKPVGEHAVEWLSADATMSERAWWRALLEYERAHFLQTATSETRASASTLQPGVSAVCKKFEWELPELLRRIKARYAITDDLRRPVTLLFSRTRAGKIYVMEVDALTTAIFAATDGHRDEHGIAGAAAVDLATARPILNSLIEIGALVAASAGAEAEQFQPERVLGI